MTARSAVENSQARKLIWIRSQISVKHVASWDNKVCGVCAADFVPAEDSGARVTVAEGAGSAGVLWFAVWRLLFEVVARDDGGVASRVTQKDPLSASTRVFLLGRGTFERARGTLLG